MKKYIIFPILFTATISLSSCMKEEMQPSSPEGSRKTLVFEGDFSVSTKIQFEDAEDGIHTLTWTAGDAIGIFSFDQTETNNDNIQAILHETTAGASRGIFIPQDRIITIPPEEEGGQPTEDIIHIEYPESSDERFVVYYPYMDGIEINVDDGCLHSAVKAEQVQDAVGDRKVLANGFATGVATVKAGSQKATFALRHSLAYICIKAASSEFAGYQLHGVQLFDKGGNAALTGEYAVDPIEGTLSVIEGTTDASVRVDVADHDFTTAPEKSEVYLAVLPGDYSSADMYIAVTFINADGATQTVPMKFDRKCNFPAGSLTTIDLGDITSADNAFPWYETSEKRDLIRLWAYGPQNTYMAMRPETEGQTTILTINVKARGDFNMVREPKYYSLLTPSELGDPGVGAGIRKFLSLDGTAEGEMISAGGSTGEPAYLPVSADYTITVHVLDQTVATGRWGTVALYDENHDVIWSYMIVGYKEGDEPKAMEYNGGFAMMDRFLGQGNGSRLAEEAGDFDASAVAYFQWGRKDPFTWASSNGLEHIYRANYRTEPFAAPGESTFYPSSRVGAGTKWYASDVRWDLWGGFNNTSDWYDPECGGAKTVYDPCPEGYRIPDGRSFNAIGSATEIWEVSGAHNTQTGEYVKTDSPFYSVGYSTLAYKTPSGEYDYWPFLGYVANQGASYDTGRAGDTKKRFMYAWGNGATYADMSSNTYKGQSFEYTYWSAGPIFNTRHDTFMCYCLPVRCQKDDLGR